MSDVKMITEYANAKINLYLDVLGAREDGFHDIVSIMQTVSLSDRLDIEASRATSEGKISLSCNWDHIPLGADNLVWKAIRAFCIASDIELDVRVHLEKHIPSEAGLAGGSSDAAAVLRALRREFAPDMSEELLLACAASLGSDVPFCVRGGSAICTGRGEIMTRLEGLPRLFLVIMKSGERVSTGKAYQKIDGLVRDFDARPSPDAVRELFEGSSVSKVASSMFNIFEEAVLPECPIACQMKEALVSNGAIASMMSGSGSAVFGIFENEDDAISAVKQLGDKADFAVSSSEYAI